MKVFNIRPGSIILTAIAILIASSPLPAQSYGDDSWYTDALRGFALQRPAGFKFVKSTLDTELVRFVRPKNLSGSPIILSVLKGSAASEAGTSFDHLTTAIINSMRAESFQIESAPQGPAKFSVAGRDAIALAGPVGAPSLKQFRADIWISLGDAEFLVIRGHGKLDDRAAVQKAVDSATVSLKLFDPEITRRQLRKDLGSGSDIVTRLDAQRLGQLTSTGDLWFAMIRNDEICGFVCVRTRPGKWRGTDGLKTRIISATRASHAASPYSTTGGNSKSGAAAAKTVRVVYENSFCANDLSIEKWDVASLITNGDNEISQSFSSIRQGDMLLITHTSGPRKGLSDTQQLPPGGYVLPRPLAWSPARLLDRIPGSRAAFAQYNWLGEKIDMRSVEAVGPCSIILGGNGKRFESYEFTDSSSLGSPVSRVFLDDSGWPLKIEAASGEIIQRTTENAIKTIFAKELGMLKLKSSGK